MKKKPPRICSRERAGIVPQKGNSSHVQGVLRMGGFPRTSVHFTSETRASHSADDAAETCRFTASKQTVGFTIESSKTPDSTKVSVVIGLDSSPLCRISGPWLCTASLSPLFCPPPTFV
jgi:hypothetical protein